jgi:hypothetical protein
MRLTGAGEFALDMFRLGELELVSDDHSSFSWQSFQKNDIFRFAFTLILSIVTVLMSL